MKYFVALLRMKDVAKNAEYRPQHIDFLTENEKAGKIFARGKFMGGEGGMVIYIADSREEAAKLAENDPLVRFGARTLEVFEWDVQFAK